MNLENEPGNEEHTAREVVGEHTKNDCLAYLLGEMDASQRSIFETQLSDPAVADELLRQSDNLFAVANVDHFNKPSPQVEPSVVSRWPLVATVAVLAASLLLAVIFPLRDPDNTSDASESSEELLIAKAWVQQPALGLETSNDWSENEFDDLAPLEESSDEATSWMVAAVAASGENNDG